MKQKKIITTIIFLLLGLVGLHGQETVQVSGGDAKGSGASVSYSLGQVVYTSNSSVTSGSVSQGVQQSYNISTLGVNETRINLTLSLFPNPTTDILILEVNDYNKENLSYQLLDMKGKQLSDSKIKAQQTQISMIDLPPATYFINIVNHQNKNVQSFKIIKN